MALNMSSQLVANQLFFGMSRCDIGEHMEVVTAKKLFTLLDLCVSSLRRGHANLLCIVPILTDDPRRESNQYVSPRP